MNTWPFLSASGNAEGLTSLPCSVVVTKLWCGNRLGHLVALMLHDQVYVLQCGGISELQCSMIEATCRVIHKVGCHERK